jgi:PIN domain nuclease of toxin-antitoxin system
MGSFTMILMDTCAIIWDALEPDKLSKNALNAINKADESNALIISDISIWEISMLIKKKRIEVDTTAANFINLFLQSRSVSVQSISPEIAELSVNFGADINNDPADRIIAATSIILNTQLVTADQNLIDSQMINTVW